MKKIIRFAETYLPAEIDFVTPTKDTEANQRVRAKIDAILTKLYFNSIDYCEIVPFKSAYRKEFSQVLLQMMVDYGIITYYESPYPIYTYTFELLIDLKPFIVDKFNFIDDEYYTDVVHYINKHNAYIDTFCISRITGEPWKHPFNSPLLLTNIICDFELTEDKQIGAVYEVRLGDFYYIGQTSNLLQRAYQHTHELKCGEHPNSILQMIYSKTDLRPVITVLHRSDDKQELLQIEKQYIKEHQHSGFLVNYLHVEKNLRNQIFEKVKSLIRITNTPKQVDTTMSIRAQKTIKKHLKSNSKLNKIE